MSRIAVFIVFIILFSCSESEQKRPKDILSPEVFTAVMIDVQLVEGMKSQRVFSPRDAAPDTRDLYGHIFEKHGISQEAFVNAYDYYKKRPGEMEEIFEHVLDSLTKLDAEVKQEMLKEDVEEADSIKAAYLQRLDSLRSRPVSK